MSKIDELTTKFLLNLYEASAAVDSSNITFDEWLEYRWIVRSEFKSALLDHFKELVGEMREVNKHENHGEMDGTYCYACNECYDEEKEPRIGNSHYNQAKSEILQKIEKERIA